MEPRGRRWVFPMTLALGALLIGGLLWFTHRPPAPPTAEQIAALRSLLQEELGEYTEALHGDGDARAAEEKLRAKIGGLPESLRPAFGRVVTAHRAAAHAGGRGHEEADELAVAIDALDRALSRAQVPLFVDAEVIAQGGRAFAIVFAFDIVRTVPFETASGPVRALYLRRLDKMNWRYSMVAYAQSERDEVSVLLEHVDDMLREQVLPALGKDAIRPLWTEDDAPLSEAVQNLADKCAAAVRTELGSYGSAAEFEAIRDRFAFSLARHEVQHVLDNRAGGKRTDRAKAELSAYLGELARPGGVPNLTLALLFGYAQERHSSAEAVATRELLAELAKELHLSGSDTDIQSALIDTPPATREQAARTAWERRFGKPLPEITVSP